MIKCRIRNHIIQISELFVREYEYLLEIRFIFLVEGYENCINLWLCNDF